MTSGQWLDGHNAFHAIASRSSVSLFLCVTCSKACGCTVPRLSEGRWGAARFVAHAVAAASLFRSQPAVAARRRASHAHTTHARNTQVCKTHLNATNGTRTVRPRQACSTTPPCGQPRGKEGHKSPMLRPRQISRTEAAQGRGGAGAEVGDTSTEASHDCITDAYRPLCFVSVVCVCSVMSALLRSAPPAHSPFPSLFLFRLHLSPSPAVGTAHVEAR
jgi:hypothetical protein